MKIKSLLTCAAALAFASSAFATDYTIRLTGSTAFRGAVYNSILAAISNDRYTYSEKAGGDGLSKAKYATFIGNIGVNDTYTIYCSFEGSSEGVEAAVIGKSRNFIPAATVPLSGSSVAGGENTTSTATEVATATMGFSDVYASTATAESGSLLGYSDVDVDDTIVGITPFVFIVNESTPGTITNISAEQFRALAYQGTVTASGLGAEGDSNLVYLIGRTPSSGTRATVLAVTGYGIANPVVQYKVTTDAGEVNASAPVNNGNGGYYSGGDLSKVMKAASAFGYMLGYIGTGSDLNTATGAGARIIKFDGVSLSDGGGALDTTFANIKNGSYTYWSKQHFMIPTSPADAGQTLFRNAVAAQIPTNLGTAGIDTGLMAADRIGDGGLVLW